MKGDYNDEKAIICKAIDDTTYAQKEVKLNEYVKVRSLTINNNDDFSISPNSGEKANTESLSLIYSYDMNYRDRRAGGYDLLHIKSSFSANLPDVVSGDYGLKIILICYD